MGCESTDYRMIISVLFPTFIPGKRNTKVQLLLRRTGSTSCLLLNSPDGIPMTTRSRQRQVSVVHGAVGQTVSSTTGNLRNRTISNRHHSRPIWLKDPRFSMHLHSPSRKLLHVHGRPMAPRKPRFQYIRLASSNPRFWCPKSKPGKPPSQITASCNRTLTLSQPFYYNWTPSVSASSNSGSWSTPPSDNSYEAESSASERSSSTKIINCSDCSGDKAVGNVGGSSNGYVEIKNIQSNQATRTTIRCRYLNGDKSTRYLNVQVNGGGSQKVAVVPSKDGNTTGIFSFTTSLNAGGSNRIRFSGVNGGWG